MCCFFSALGNKLLNNEVRLFVLIRLGKKSVEYVEALVNQIDSQPGLAACRLPIYIS